MGAGIDEQDRDGPRVLGSPRTEAPARRYQSAGFLNNKVKRSVFPLTE
jgi:hypothetical protein